MRFEIIWNDLKCILFEEYGFLGVEFGKPHPWLTQGMWELGAKNCHQWKIRKLDWYITVAYSYSFCLCRWWVYVVESVSCDTGVPSTQFSASPHCLRFENASTYVETTNPDSGQPFRGWVADLCYLFHPMWSFQFSVHCVLIVDHIWIVWLAFALVIDRLLSGRPGFEQGCTTARRQGVICGRGWLRPGDPPRTFCTSVVIWDSYSVHICGMYIHKILNV